MKLVKNRTVAPDEWHIVDDDEATPEGRPIIVSLARFKADRERLIGRNTHLGLRLKSNEAPASVAEDLDRFAVIALEFPSFRDGRAYSHATQLRRRFGYRGEVRAVGDVLRDQMLYMARCGIDAFEVADDFPDAGLEAIFGEFSDFYQPAADQATTVLAKRQLA